MICPHCEIMLTRSESRQKNCPVCQQPLASKNKRPASKGSASKKPPALGGKPGLGNFPVSERISSPEKTVSTEKTTAPKKPPAPLVSQPENRFQKFLINNVLAFTGAFLIGCLLIGMVAIAFRKGKTDELGDGITIFTSLFAVGGIIMGIVKSTQQDESERMAEQEKKRQEAREMLQVLPGVILGFVSGILFAFSFT